MLDDGTDSELLEVRYTNKDISTTTNIIICLITIRIPINYPLSSFDQYNLCSRMNSFVTMIH